MSNWTLGQLGKNKAKQTQTKPKRTQNEPNFQKGQNERNCLSNNELRTKNYER